VNKEDGLRVFFWVAVAPLEAPSLLILYCSREVKKGKESTFARDFCPKLKVKGFGRDLERF